MQTNPKFLVQIWNKAICQKYIEVKHFKVEVILYIWLSVQMNENINHQSQF